MPKIKTKQFTIAGKWTDVNFYYTSNKGFYAKGIPEEVESVAERHFEINGYEKECELKEAIRTALFKYHEYIEKKRKVIAYRVTMTTDMRSIKTGEGSWSGSKPWVPDCFKRGCDMDGFHSGYGFVVEWKILMEVKARSTTYYDIDKDQGARFARRLDEGFQVVDWTPEREAAFVQIDQALEKAVQKLATVLGDQEKLLFLVDSGVKLLEGN